MFIELTTWENNGRFWVDHQTEDGVWQVGESAATPMAAACEWMAAFHPEAASVSIAARSDRCYIDMRQPVKLETNMYGMTAVEATSLMEWCSREAYGSREQTFKLYEDMLAWFYDAEDVRAEIDKGWDMVAKEAGIA